MRAEVFSFLPNFHTNTSNTGLTESGLRQAFDLIEEKVSREQAEIARTSLAKIVAARQKK
jgi:hypothetical protein